MPKSLPSSVDLRATCPPIQNQGDSGSTTAYALTTALQMAEKKAGLPGIPLSRLFLYFNARVLENRVARDIDTTLWNGIIALVDKGCCSEELWPYDISKFAEGPSDACLDDARSHLLRSLTRLRTLDDMRNCLADGFPFVFNLTVYQSFDSDQVARTGIVTMSGDDEDDRYQGSMTVTATGYDDRQRTILLRNSLGTQWGMQGYFTIPYDYITSSDMANEFWMLRM